MGRPTQYSVSLSQEEKEKLLAMSKDNKLSARVSKGVLILLALDNIKRIRILLTRSESPQYTCRCAFGENPLFVGLRRLLSEIRKN